MKNRIHLVADLLMGAAHADGHVKATENAAIKRLLREMLGVPVLPIDLSFRVDEFELATLDLPRVGKSFAGDSLVEKRRLLELLANVRSGGEETDLAEDAYLRQVGNAIGLGEAHFRDLAAAIIEERAIGLSREMPALRLGTSPLKPST